MPALGPNVHLDNTDDHLFSVRLTTLIPSNQSTLGLQMSHLGIETTIALYLIKHLDTLYTHGKAALQGSDPEVGIPTFFPGGVGPLPEYDPSTNNLGSSVPFKSFDRSIQSYVADFMTSSRVALQFANSELQVLKDQYQLDSSIGVSVQSIVYILDYRKWSIGHPSFPPNLPSLVAIICAASPIDISAASTPGQVAMTIREHITKLHSSEDGEALRWLSHVSHHMHERAVYDRVILFTSDEKAKEGGKSAIGNSNIRIDWSFSFGFQEHQVSYHTEHTFSRHLRVFRAEREQKGDKVEVYSNMPNVLAEKLREYIRSDRERWELAAGASV
ncbi:hypothetical protein IAR50_003082 [Cryptococcus sp. DSM 104548]